jgi:large subunit ribosomal protein L19
MNVIDEINKRSIEQLDTQLKEKDGANYAHITDFKPGDQLNVAVRVVEGEKERIQNFKGIIIGRKGSGINETFLIRKISNGVGVERVFPLHSPMIQSITLIREGRSRRAKLYYLRGMSDKKIRQKISKN